MLLASSHLTGFRSADYRVVDNGTNSYNHQRCTCACFLCLSVSLSVYVSLAVSLCVSVYCLSLPTPASNNDSRACCACNADVCAPTVGMHHPPSLHPNERIQVYCVMPSTRAFVILFLESFTFLYVSDYLHQQYHIKDTWLERSPMLKDWFLQRRLYHFHHHHRLQASKTTTLSTNHHFT